jgi:6-pyruvoyltetrahydropterin/6-carboxytetrahydropterin synthase
MENTPETEITIQIIDSALFVNGMFAEESGKFYIRIEGRFESAHYLYDYFPDGSDEPIHGHSWKVEVFLEGKTNIRPDGISYDFLTAKTKLTELVHSIDHILINEHPDFKGVNPTSENVARWFFHGLKQEVANSNGIVRRIVIHEGPENLAFFEPDRA